MSQKKHFPASEKACEIQHQSKWLHNSYLEPDVLEKNHWL